MAPPTTCWAPVQNSPVSTQCQLVSTSIKSYQGGCLFKVSIKWLFKKNGVLAVSGSDLGLELKTSSLRQSCSFACFSSTCLLFAISSHEMGKEGLESSGFLKFAKIFSQIHWKAMRAHCALKKKVTERLKILRHGNCSYNFWSKTSKQTKVMVHLSLTFLIQHSWFILA